jgi:hypothetical protein
MIYYKYRNFSDLRFLFDIFLNDRLFAAKYMNMNDPMEGHYLVKPNILDEETKRIIKDKKQSYGIVSLSTDSENPLMWAHYADGHNGIAIGVEIDDDGCEILPVRYRGLSELTHLDAGNPQDVAKNILTYKHDFWSYENEYRALIQGSSFVKVRVLEVVFGRKVSNEDREYYKGIISKLNPLIEFHYEVT